MLLYADFPPASAEADSPFKASAVSPNWSRVETRLAALFGSGNSFVRAVSRLSVAVQLVIDKLVLVRRKRRLVLGGHEPYQELLALWGYDPLTSPAFCTSPIESVKRDG